MFPELDPFEIERMRRFGEARSFAQGEAIFTAGQVGPGLVVILSGEVDIVRHEFSHESLIVTHGPGQFMGELAQLAGRPALVDAVATKPVQALIIAPERLRALLIAEAELGERIMRALILRRVGLLETGVGGPIIVGRADNADVLRLQGFLRRNGHPHQLLNSETDDEAKALIERFHIDPGQLPIVLCPGGQMLRNPSEHELAAVSVWFGPSIRRASITLSLWEPDPPVLPPQSMPRRKDSPSSCSIAAPLAVRPVPRLGSKIISAFRLG